MNPYENLTPEERLDRICQILVRWIYRAEAEKSQEVAAQTTPLEKGHYSLRHTAGILGISKRTVQRWIGTGKLIAQRKLNGRISIEARCLEFMRKQIRSKQGYLAVSEKPFKICTGAIGAARTNTGNHLRESPELKDVGIVIGKAVHRRKKILILACLNDKKILGDLPDDYFDAPEGKDYYRNRKKVLIRCSKCKQVIFF